ncbi:hypothetical protein ACROYT_G002309 [Oculina patagonica]
MSQNLLEELLPNSFAGLKNLLNLNLTGNNLQIWNSHDASLHLPSLMIIDVQGNMGWRPEEKYLLELPRLKEIRNVSWAAECLDCWLIKNVSEELIQIFNNTHFQAQPHRVTCFAKHYTFGDYLMLLARYRFVVRKCKSFIDCIERKEANITMSQPCWPTNQRVLSMQLVLGIIGGCLNLVVFFNILLTKSLRKNVSMVLVSNLALGDTLTCIYSATMAGFIVSNQYKDLYHHSGSLSDIQCPRVGSLWVLGQCTTSITSVALTLERYLCIVFSMKPDIRMTPRLASLAIAFNWVVAVFMMSMAHFFNLYRRNFLCVPITIETLSFNTETRYTIAMGATGISLYLVTIPMYVHIYRVVKRSSQQMGVQRESTLAKRIAILVGTNLVFFFLPILLLGKWALVIRSSAKMASINSIRAIEVWIPQYCLIINSCLNPLVHAFRNDKFKNALKRNLKCNPSNVTAPAVQAAPIGGVRNRRNVTLTVQAATSMRNTPNVTSAGQTATPGGVRNTPNVTSAGQAATPGDVRNTPNVTSAGQAATPGGVRNTPNVTSANNVTLVVQADSSEGVRDTSSVTPAIQSASLRDVT